MLTQWVSAFWLLFQTFWWFIGQNRNAFQVSFLSTDQQSDSLKNVIHFKQITLLQLCYFLLFLLPSIYPQIFAFLLHATAIQIQQMYTQKQEQKIKTIDLNEYLDVFHNYRNALNEKQSINSHPFTVKLRNHLNVRAETCFSIQSFQPQSRMSNRNTKQTRYSKEQLHKEGLTDIDTINLEEFMHVVLNREEVKEEEKTHQFIRSLNGTWFHGTDDSYKTNKITSTLGIKKTRSLLRPKTERYNPQNLRDKVDFTKQFRQAGLFPSRKINSHNRKKLAKNPSSNIHEHLQSPNKNNEGSLKYQIVKTIKQQIQNSKSPAKNTNRVARCTFAAIANNFNNQRIMNNINKQAIVKGKKMMIHD